VANCNICNKEIQEGYICAECKGSESPVRPGATDTQTCRWRFFSQQSHKNSLCVAAANATDSAASSSGACPAPAIFSSSDATATDITAILKTGAATATADTFASHQSPATAASHPG